jgi:hypothetical protein
MSFRQCNCKSMYNATGDYTRCNKCNKCNKHEIVRENFAKDDNRMIVGNITANRTQPINLAQLEQEMELGDAVGPGGNIAQQQSTQSTQPTQTAIKSNVNCSLKAGYPNWHPCFIDAFKSQGPNKLPLCMPSMKMISDCTSQQSIDSDPNKYQVPIDCRSNIAYQSDHPCTQLLEQNQRGAMKTKNEIISVMEPQQWQPFKQQIDGLKSQTPEQAALIIKQYADLFNQISNRLNLLANNPKLAQTQLQRLAGILNNIQNYMIKINDAFTPLLSTNLQQTIQDTGVNLQSILNDIAALKM